jgi:ATP-dependent RNA helicase RhlE
MLSLGFRDELDQILSCLPQRRQNLLFSATLPSDISALTDAMLQEPLTVDVTQPSTDPEIEEHVYQVAPERKTAVLIKLLAAPELRQALVFISMKKTGDALVRALDRAGIQAACFHADKSQHERTRTLRAFRDGSLRVLLATDLAARGIDIEDLPVVINFELPRSPNDYLHRIGRTGRAGRTGIAISLITAADEQHFRVIEKRIKRRLPREQR